MDKRQMYVVALQDAFWKLNPRSQIKNPVMFVTFVGAIVATVYAIFGAGSQNIGFELQLSLWLWFTVFFANFSEALAEGRGKAQAATLKRSRSEAVAKRKRNDGSLETINATELKKGDVVVCIAGDLIPSDGEVIDGIASVDESAITGESAPVIRESGGDRSAVTGGTRVLSDRIVVRVTAEQGNTFIERMIRLVEGAQRQKTPNEIALTVVLCGLSLIFLIVILSLKSFVDFGVAQSAGSEGILSVPVLIALLVCLIPTTIGGLLSAIGISGMDRLIRRNVIATSGRAVEAAGDIDVLLLDKTGTITFGNRMASRFIPVQGVDEVKLAEIAQMSSLADETAEGRSIVVLAKEKYNLRGEEMSSSVRTYIPFSAQTRMSGVDIDNTVNQSKLRLRKGAADSVIKYVLSEGGGVPRDLQKIVDEVASAGSTPLVVADGNKILGVIELKDVVKGGIRERFAELRKMGIRTVMITGDNPRTAAAIAAEAGVDDFMAEATPEDKLMRIRQEQGEGRLVAMTGDGTNDAPALAQADVGVAMNSGTQAAREAGNMVDLDSNPTKLIEIVEIGKQLLMTRGALTTFSIANDVAKYFAILPALFAGMYILKGEEVGPLATFNVMNLATPQSAILSAVIFNAVVIIALIPLALRGVSYRPESPDKILARNVLIYGFGGLVTPFIGIKLIDMVIHAIGIA